MADPTQRFIETGDETAEQAAQLKATKIRAKTREELMEDALAVTMGTLEGRRVIWGMLQGLGLSRSVAGPGLDTNTTMANVGRHAYAIEMLDQLKASHPAEVRLMQQENDL